MQIHVLSTCNFMGRPASVGDVIEAISPAEMDAAGYLVSIGKAQADPSPAPPHQKSTDGEGNEEAVEEADPSPAPPHQESTDGEGDEEDE